MKQFNYELTSADEVSKALGQVFNYTTKNPYKSILFHLYSIYFDDEKIRQVQDAILEMYPNACIGGTSSNGDICDGHLADYGMVMSVSVFESTDTEVYLLECPENGEALVGERVKEIIDATENIKAAEILITLKSINSHIILNTVEKCRKDVKIFGGGSADKVIAGTDTCVMNEDKVCHAGVLLVTYSR